ncbi:hypothetical protein B0H12DRAFT_1293311 [Mycena haematopus]|nr:hypothetical protein B0H12DRAFT_1293311 [Mycena haematopus]
MGVKRNFRPAKSEVGRATGDGGGMWESVHHAEDDREVIRHRCHKDQLLKHAPTARAAEMSQEIAEVEGRGGRPTNHGSDEKKPQSWLGRPRFVHLHTEPDSSFAGVYALVSMGLATTKRKRTGRTLHMKVNRVRSLFFLLRAPSASPRSALNAQPHCPPQPHFFTADSRVGSPLFSYERVDLRGRETPGPRQALVTSGETAKRTVTGGDMAHNPKAAGSLLQLRVHMLSVRGECALSVCKSSNACGSIHVRNQRYREETKTRPALIWTWNACDICGAAANGFGECSSSSTSTSTFTSASKSSTQSATRNTENRKRLDLERVPPPRHSSAADELVVRLRVQIPSERKVLYQCRPHQSRVRPAVVRIRNGEYIEESRPALACTWNASRAQQHVLAAFSEVDSARVPAARVDERLCREERSFRRSSVEDVRDELLDERSIWAPSRCRLDDGGCDRVERVAKVLSNIQKVGDWRDARDAECICSVAPSEVDTHTREDVKVEVEVDAARSYSSREHRACLEDISRWVTREADGRGLGAQLHLSRGGKRAQIVQSLEGLWVGAAQGDPVTVTSERATRRRVRRPSTLTKKKSEGESHREQAQLLRRTSRETWTPSESKFLPAPPHRRLAASRLREIRN